MSCFPFNTSILQGTVFGTDGMPVAGLPIVYTVNGDIFRTTTNACGQYRIAVPKFSAVTIRPEVGLGVNVIPESYTITPQCPVVSCLNFRLTPVSTPTVVTLSGSVLNTLGAPVANIPISYTVNGTTLTTTSNANGLYSFTAFVGSNVTITPQPGVGVSVAPPTRSLTNVVSDQPGLNFTLTPII